MCLEYFLADRVAENTEKRQIGMACRSQIGDGSVEDTVEWCQTDSDLFVIQQGIYLSGARDVEDRLE
jgi:hypothetical protein